MQMHEGELSGVSRCPHCSVANPRLSQVWIAAELPRANRSPKRAWAAWACATCGHAVLGKGEPRKENAHIAPVEQLYPRPKTAHEDLPPAARHFLQQAYDTLHAPDAAGVMSASAVDAMLKSLGYVDGALYTRIDKAAEDGVLTKGMAQWAHSVRLEANRPRHADAEKPHLTSEDALRSVEFTEALGSFLFVFTKRIERGIAAAGGSKGVAKAAPPLAQPA